MSLKVAKALVKLAKQQPSQADINRSLLSAVDELMREVKRPNEEVRRARRDVRFGRITG
jgi:hypothetical protein